MNCSMKCGHCKRKKHCNHITGICKKGCKGGFQGDRCNKGTLNVIKIIIFKRLFFCVCVLKKRFCLKINHLPVHWGRFYERYISFYFFYTSECDMNMFGQNCRSKCGHCVNNETCNHIDGQCIKGCAIGFQWPKCNTGFNI